MIIDASVGVAIVTDEAASDACFEAMGGGPAIVPALFHIELANALWKKIRRDEADALALMATWREAQLLFTTVADDALVVRALEIAVELNHPVYDCIYLALAEAMDDHVLTLDARLAARVAGTGHAARVRMVGA